MEELNQALDKLDALAKSDPEEIREKVWNSISIVADLVVRAKDANFEPGWASKVVDGDGVPIFSTDDGNALELTALTVIKPIFVDRRGGGDLKSDLTKEKFTEKLSVASAKQLAKEKAAAAKEYMKEFSIDDSYMKAKEVIDSLDTRALKYSKEGPMKLFHGDEATDILIPNPYVPGLKIPPKAASLLITLFVEVIRLLFSFGPLQSDITRKITSIILAVINVLQGDWKVAVLSGVGVFGTSSLIVGNIGKLMLAAFRAIGPTNQDAMLLDIFRSAKSFPIGVILWSLATFAPQPIRDTMNEKFTAIDAVIQDAVTKLNAKITNDNDESKKIKLNLMATDLNPTVNIQAIQAIASHPAIVCSTELQAVVQDAAKDVFAKLLLELCNIPLNKNMIELMCPEIQPLEKSIELYIKSI